jgi:CubicO group peptidase (beta-lactamase class C family)
MKTASQIFCPPLLILFVLIITACAKQSSEPENNSIYDNQKIDASFSQAAQLGNIKSLVVSRNGNIIKEQYWRTGGSENIHDVRSVTKSVVGILTGIAIEKGLIKSVDQPVKDFLDLVAGNYPSDKSGITIKHLLSMSGGFQWDELTSVSGYNNWVSSANQVNFILNTPMANLPGTVFTYNSAGIHLLSVIITQSSGMNTKQFADKYLFEPLGITERVWETDHQGFYNGGAGLQISPHDMIKIGELILNKGEYKGKRIVSANWIDQLTQFKVSTGNSQPYSSSYGYCWWLGQKGNISYSFANGWGGQFIVVVPSLDLVVTATNQWSGVTTTVANSQWYSTLTIIMEQIIPSFN